MVLIFSAVFIVGSLIFQFVAWRQFTYEVTGSDLRVHSGVFERKERLVPLGYSRKYWYDDALSASVRSITTPGGDKRVYLDPNLLPLLRGRTVALVDDAVSSGATLDAPWRLIESLGAEVLACGVVMRQGSRWADTLGPDRASKVVGVFDTPLLRAVPEGWVRREGTTGPA